MDYTELEYKAGRSLKYLEETEEEYAQLKAQSNSLNEHRKVVKAALFFSSEEKTAAAREQDAYRQSEYTEHLKLMEETEARYITMLSKRLRANTTIELYRTISANHRS